MSAKPAATWSAWRSNWLLAHPLASLLAHSPESGRCTQHLERYAQGAPPQVLGELARYPAALSYLIAIFGYSGYLAETLLSEPQLVVQFARDRNFTKLKSKEDLAQDFARFSTTNPDPWLAALLARFKRRNYLRIVLKDVLGLSTLGDFWNYPPLPTSCFLTPTCSVIANWKSAMDSRSTATRRAASCAPGFSIISLGKLGGNELNYNSDIDLLFLYSHDGETAGGNERESITTNKEYFVHVAHAITRTITQPTSQGEVFRVDLRLRPEGEQGDLAISSILPASITNIGRGTGNCRCSSRRAIPLATQSLRATFCAAWKSMFTARPETLWQWRAFSLPGKEFPRNCGRAADRRLTLNVIAAAFATSSFWCNACSACTVCTITGCVREERSSPCESSMIKAGFPIETTPP